ncbi:Zn-dependent dipeptidase, microsomal dipeptidase [Tautonia sociabilis]|uniref:Zn-dependent dipeptidase, microsomal dipeptidase n=1 Tax=Tautonia sociabilis TaxID=2080755 RepID=A0A432MPB0_9BACT|nr:Zn-dependent dipeptidase, microsomal dipeptidase [Tautonia sociabilis]RUL89007.1 Zn-dependent dipeptidase, microsomal dipeptidase [Tautonia sociabilis]
MTQLGGTRLVDLAVEWPLQYAGESVGIDEASYPGVRGRLAQVEGYLSATAIALVWFGPSPEGGEDPWAEVSGLMSRVEAEFSGRLLSGPDDLGRLDREPAEALTWAVAGLRGAAAICRSEGGTDRLEALIGRGVRAVRLVGLVDRPAGSTDDLGLGESDRELFAALAGLGGPRILVDLAGLGPRAAGEAIASCGESGGELVPIVSLGTLQDGKAGGLSAEDFERLRSLGGVVGLGMGRPFVAGADALAREIDAFASRTGGVDGLAIGTGFLGVEEAAEGLGTAPAVLSWLAGRFDEETSARLASENARATLNRAIAGSHRG